jgi:hypothetical protein
MKVLGEVLNHSDNVLWDGGSAGNVRTQNLNLVGGGNLRSQQQPQKSLREGLSSSCTMLTNHAQQLVSIVIVTFCLGELLLNFRDRKATEPDSLKSLDKHQAVVPNTIKHIPLGHLATMFQ